MEHITLCLEPCARGQILPLLPTLHVGISGHYLTSPCSLLRLGTGFCLHDDEAHALLQVTGKVWLPGSGSHAIFCPLLQALEDLPQGIQTLSVRKNGYSLAWVTLSDKGACGLREDLSGPVIADAVAAVLPLAHSQGFLLPDEPQQLRALLTDLALSQDYDLICTTGGTGLSPRDQTPQVTASLLDMPLPGMVQAMLDASLKKTPYAVLSRACAGTLGQSIILNLPGSRKAVAENLAAVLPALPHALAKLQGDTTDCGN